MVEVFLAFDDFFLPELEQQATHHRGLEEYEASALVVLLAVILEHNTGLLGSPMARGTAFNMMRIKHRILVHCVYRLLEKNMESDSSNILLKDLNVFLSPML